MALILEHHFSEGIGPFATWTGSEVDGQNLSFSDGIAKLGVRQGDDGTWKGSALALPTPLTYGRFVVRCRLPKGAFKGLLCLWPADQSWPPEVDFYEIGAELPDRLQCNQTLHFGIDNFIIHDSIPGDFSQWHTISCGWRPGRLRYSLDYGSAVVQRRSVFVPSTPMKLHLKSNPGSVPSPEAGDFEIDWVRVYS